MLRVELERYGKVAVHDVEKPAPGEDEVLVRVAASSLNAADWYFFAGRPYVARPMMGLRRPKSATVGIDFAGTVEAVGSAVEAFRPGDAVFGSGDGALAEYLIVKDAVHRKPESMSFDEAAAVPVAAVTALQALRDHGAVRTGMRVLVNGASGGVGTFAVQIARALGAEVHAVCSTRNVAQTESLGAARVFDYEQEDFTRSGERYDVLFDNAGRRSWRAMRRVLAPTGVVVCVGGPRNRFVGPLPHVGACIVGSKLSSQRAAFFIAKPNRDDLAALTDLIEQHGVKSVIERRYELHDVSEAFAHIGAGHARAKIVVAVSHPNE
jgi:NADPH:quinone reductase-like Zn-dependent oxidoreductase